MALTNSVWSHVQLHSESHGPSHSHKLPWHGQCLVSHAAPIKILRPFTLTKIALARTVFGLTRSFTQERPLTLTWIVLAWTVFGLTRSSRQHFTAHHTHINCLGMDSVWSHAQLHSRSFGPSHSHGLPWHGQCLVSRAAPGNILRPITLT